MLPKKRKFDLSKFELDRTDGGGAAASSSGAQQPGLPASGFLTPETVHEAFAGNSSYLRAVARPGSEAARPRQPPVNSIVDLSQRPPVSVGQDPAPAPHSAFSRPAPATDTPPPHARLKPAVPPAAPPPLHSDTPSQSFKRVRQPASGGGAGGVLQPGPAPPKQPGAGAGHRGKGGAPHR